MLDGVVSIVSLIKCKNCDWRKHCEFLIFSEHCPKRHCLNEEERNFDGIASYRAALSRTEREAKKKQQEKWNKAMQDVMKSEKSDIKNNVPKCPTCSSANIKKIGSVNKTVSIALLGIFFFKNRKTVSMFGMCIWTHIGNFINDCV